MPIGNRIYLQRPLAEAALLEGLAAIPAANIADTMGRSSAMHPRLRLISNPSQPRFAARALTVKGRAGDNLLLHKALDLGTAGDAIIVANEASDNRSLMGEIMATYACLHRGITALILDGPIRDLEELSQMDCFIYATGSTPGGPYKDGPGELNVPIACGEISVNPGDIIVGDRDGIVVVPLRDAAEILAAATALQAQDAAKVKAAATGSADRSWVDRTLTAKQCEIIDAAYPGL